MRAGERVWVAMSGGVDSAVAAALTLESGAAVTGVTLDLGRGAPDAVGIQAASRISARLGIPHLVLDAAAEFETLVVGPSTAEYLSGRTPNPCVWCNDRVKFGLLLDAARRAGARLATGHYVRRVRAADAVPPDVLDAAAAEGGRWLLSRGGGAKDQSYFMYRLTSEVLENVAFPLGDLGKESVREKASALGLSAAHLPESQDACFAGTNGYAALIEERRGRDVQAGIIEDESGRILGRHSGVHRFTVGQRKGLGVSTPEPVYVLRIDALRSSVIVGPESRLEAVRLKASDGVWHLRRAHLACDVRLRSTGPLIPARVTCEDGRLIALLETPAKGAAPGQALVCYKGDAVVGGGTIEEAT